MKKMRNDQMRYRINYLSINNGLPVNDSHHILFIHTFCYSVHLISMNEKYLSCSRVSRSHHLWVWTKVVTNSHGTSLNMNPESFFSLNLILFLHFFLSLSLCLSFQWQEGCCIFLYYFPSSWLRWKDECVRRVTEMNMSMTQPENEGCVFIFFFDGILGCYRYEWDLLSLDSPAIIFCPISILRGFSNLSPSFLPVVSSFFFLPGNEKKDWLGIREMIPLYWMHGWELNPITHFSTLATH